MCCTANLTAEHEPCDVLTCRCWILLITHGFKQTAGDGAHVTQLGGRGPSNSRKIIIHFNCQY